MYLVESQVQLSLRLLIISGIFWLRDALKESEYLVTSIKMVGGFLTQNTIYLSISNNDMVLRYNGV